MRHRKMRGTIWVAGHNYVTSLPTKWGEKIKNEYNSQIEKLQLNDKIIITPPFDPFKKKVITLKVDQKKTVKIKMNVISAYLQGYDIIELTSETPFSDDTITFLNKRTIPGFYGELSSDRKCYRLIVTTLFEVEIPNLFNEIKSIIHQLSDYLQEYFKSFPRMNEIDKKCINDLEHRLDEMNFHFMRFLNKSLSYADIFEKVGLEDDRSIIHLNSAFLYIERLGDLYTDIVKRLDKISKLKPSANLESFQTYYQHASEVLLTALNSLTDPYKGVEIIEGKASKWKTYKDGVLIDAEKNIKQTIYSESDPKVIREMTILEGKLYAIPDISSNICEQLWNKKKI